MACTSTSRAWSCGGSRFTHWNQTCKTKSKAFSHALSFSVSGWDGKEKERTTVEEFYQLQCTFSLTLVFFYSEVIKSSNLKKASPKKYISHSLSPRHKMGCSLDSLSQDPSPHSCSLPSSIEWE